jgi:hypothetical protein
MLGVVAEFLAQVLNMNIYGAFVALAGRAL